MEFNPSSTIYLCRVDFDNSYSHQVYFSSKAIQQDYFVNTVQKTLTNYLTVRETQPDGGVRSFIRVNMGIDEIRSLGVNYMYYQNAHHSTKYFYAFITNLIYINEGITKIEFETDVYQTYLFDLEIKPSFVVREHSATDNIGDNVVPESFNYQDYNYTSMNISNLTEWGYLVGSSEKYNGDSGVTISLKSGIAQGLYFYYFKDITPLANFLESMENDCIQFITVIPKFSVSKNDIVNVFGEGYEGNGYVSKSTEPAMENLPFSFSGVSYTFDGYIPKNNKLFTNPYCNIVVTNNAGNEVILNREDFGNTQNILFNMYADVSVSPSVMLVPIAYKGVTMNFNYSLSISGFPQCSHTADYFKLWLAKNQGSLAIDGLTSLVNIGAGVGLLATGAGAGWGVTHIMQGALGVANTINSTYQASKTENLAKKGNPQNNLLTAMKANKFYFYYRMIKRDFAETVDNYFTMYGYQTNKVKVPNLNKRPKFNYVQTVDVNVVCKSTCAVPTDDILKFKSIFNNGVTLWNRTATMYDYTVNNSP